MRMFDEPRKKNPTHAYALIGRVSSGDEIVERNLDGYGLARAERLFRVRPDGVSYRIVGGARERDFANAGGVWEELPGDRRSNPSASKRGHQKEERKNAPMTTKTFDVRLDWSTIADSDEAFARWSNDAPGSRADIARVVRSSGVGAGEIEILTVRARTPESAERLVRRLLIAAGIWRDPWLTDP